MGGYFPLNLAYNGLLKWEKLGLGTPLHTFFSGTLDFLPEFILSLSILDSFR
jgi:hypothetical protein